MKITSDTTGNYSLQYVKNNKTLNTSADKGIQTEKADLNKNERKYFAGIYPDRKEEIINYHFYKSTGQMHGVTVGSLLDRRG